MKTGYDDLRKYMDMGDIKNAAEELNRLLLKFRGGQEIDDDLAVLAARFALQVKDEELAWGFIREGLLFNCRNAMLYFMLGKYYEDKNINQAWLCYENAEYYCDSESELTGIKRWKEYIEQLEGWSVHKVSIVVLTHNTKDLNIQCIESIRDTNYSSSYELIVVDNASTDGTVEWLKEQKDIKLICNQENKGFPEGCNQGIRASEDGNDILLLNSDTIGLPNAIFWLRMGLYEDEQTGITGATSNSVINHQRIEEKFNSIDEYVVYGNRLNVPMRRPYEKKTWLVGFAMLIKRKALDEVGGWTFAFRPDSMRIWICVCA